MLEQQLEPKRRLIIGCLPWKFQGGEAAFARVVAFDGEWPANP